MIYLFLVGCWSLIYYVSTKANQHIAILVPFGCCRDQRMLGPLWDGGLFEFASQGDLVVSPW